MEAFAQLCYTGAAIFVRLSVREQDILSRFSGLLDEVCRDSCLEFFFSPGEDRRYFNFEFNPAGALYLGFGRDRYHTSRQVLVDYREQFSVIPRSFEGGWGIDFSIPLSFIQLYVPSFRLESGTTLRGNFYKCGDETKHPHYLVWNPIVSDHPDFHQPKDFGTILLE
ncbi:hypothetical protein AGMMS49928_03060 [Spirochaetia bacterium]|nr:hypothetical protein AGMMS49928_03060 [Spirochaetia bacterium]